MVLTQTTKPSDISNNPNEEDDNRKNNKKEK